MLPVPSCPPYLASYSCAVSILLNYFSCLWQSLSFIVALSFSLFSLPPLPPSPSPLSPHLSPSACFCCYRSPQSPLEAPSSTKAPSRAKALGSSAFKDLVTSMQNLQKQMFDGHSALSCWAGHGHHPCQEAQAVTETLLHHGCPSP